MKGARRSGWAAVERPPGRVRGADGRPLGGAQAMLSPGRGGRGGGARRHARNAGTFEVAPLAPGEYDLEVLADGHSAASRSGLVVLPGQRFEIEIRLDGVGSVSGTVRSPDGAPVAGATVRGGRMWEDSRAHLQAEAVTGSDGGYTLPAIEVGPVELRARRRGDVNGDTKVVVVEQGRDAVADFVLASTGTLEGEVRFAGPRAPGSPVFVHVASGQG